MPGGLIQTGELFVVATGASIWDVLGGVGGLAAGVSLVFLLYIQSKPLVNRWALRGFLRTASAPRGDDWLTREQARGLTWKRRFKRRCRRLAFGTYQRFMTKVQRINVPRLMESFDAAKCRFA